MLSKVDTLVIDKTGTLTEGKPKLTSVISADGFDENELLRMVASLERGSEHPLAEAILAGAKEREIVLGEVAGFKSVTGKGVTGEFEGKSVGIGNDSLMTDMGAADAGLAAKAEALRSKGQTVMLVLCNGNLAGLIGVADPVKVTTAAAIAELKAAGLRIVMVTGDNKTTAASVASKLGIEFEAGVLPEGKAEVVKRLQAAGAVVAMAAGRNYAGEGGSAGDFEGSAVEPGDDAEYPAEFVLCILLQRDWGSGGCWGALSGVWFAFEPDAGGCGDEFELGFGDWERLKAPQV